MTTKPVPTITSEIFVIPLERDKHIVYAPLRRAAFIGNDATVNYLAGLNEGAQDWESTDPNGSVTEFLRRLEILDAGPEEPPTSFRAADPEPTGVTLFLTTACNLRCTYCYASAGDTPVKMMELETAVRAIDFVAGNARRLGAPAMELNYHGGGEPTAHWSVLQKSFDHAKARAAEYGLDLKSSTATNGVLTDEQIDWIATNLGGASVSFDGLPQVHDRHRLTVLGQGSSSRVIHTLKRFDQAGFPYGVRVTVTADQIEALPDSIDYICSQFRSGLIQVEPAYQLGRWSEAQSAETSDFVRAYRLAQMRARQHGKEIQYSAARVGSLTHHFCGITQDSFCVSPDGNVSACYEVFSEDNRWADVFFYGKLNGAAAPQFVANRLDHLRAQTVENREFCRGCFAKWTCAGDCYHKSLNVNGAGEFAGSDRCHITRELTKDQLVDRIRTAGGLFWHEGPPAESSARGKELIP